METRMLESFDKTKLYLKIDKPLHAKAMVLIVHGLCEHLGRYDYLTGKLLRKGFGVYRFDHRGHGQSEGTRVYYDDFTQIFEDVNAVVDLIQKEEPDLPLFVIGHSMGGYAVTLFGSHFPNKVDGFVLSGALTRNRGSIGEELPRNLDPKSYFPNELGSGVCSDPAVVEAYAKDPLVEKQISFGLFYTIFEGVQWLKENPHRFEDPVLILHGAKDGLVSYEDSLELFKEIDSDDKSLKVYSGLQHEIFNEYTKDEVIGDVLFWLEKQLDPDHVDISYSEHTDSVIEDLGL